jgi:hypothetical protein
VNGLPLASSFGLKVERQVALAVPAEPSDSRSMPASGTVNID